MFRQVPPRHSRGFLSHSLMSARTQDERDGGEHGPKTEEEEIDGRKVEITEERYRGIQYGDL